MRSRGKFPADQCALQMPFSDGGTQVNHYVWESATQAFWKDTFGTATDTDVQPTACCVIDGDEAADGAIARDHRFQPTPNTRIVLRFGGKHQCHAAIW